MSGRQNRFKDITIKWMKDNNVNYDNIYLRKTDDNRADSIVKMEMYTNNIKDNYNVEFVLDDRNQVVDMWRRDLGLKCFQVEEGNF